MHAVDCTQGRGLFDFILALRSNYVNGPDPSRAEVGLPPAHHIVCQQQTTSSGLHGLRFIRLLMCRDVFAALPTKMPSSCSELAVPRLDVLAHRLMPKPSSGKTWPTMQLPSTCTLLLE